MYAVFRAPERQGAVGLVCVKILIGKSAHQLLHADGVRAALAAGRQLQLPGRQIEIAARRQRWREDGIGGASAAVAGAVGPDLHFRQADPGVDIVAHALQAHVSGRLVAEGIGLERRRRAAVRAPEHVLPDIPIVRDLQRQAVFAAVAPVPGQVRARHLVAAT